MEKCTVVSVVAVKETETYKFIIVLPVLVNDVATTNFEPRTYVGKRNESETLKEIVEEIESGINRDLKAFGLTVSERLFVVDDISANTPDGYTAARNGNGYPNLYICDSLGDLIHFNFADAFGNLMTKTFADEKRKIEMEKARQNAVLYKLCVPKKQREKDRNRLKEIEAEFADDVKLATIYKIYMQM